MADNAYAGPVSFLVFGFPAATPVGAGLQAVLELVDHGSIDILDLEFVTKGSDGTPGTMSLADIQQHNDVDLSVFEGAFSGILTPGDLTEIASELEADQFALALVYEDRTLARASEIWASSGGFEVFSGGVDIADLADTTEQE